MVTIVTKHLGIQQNIKIYKKNAINNYKVLPSRGKFKISHRTVDTCHVCTVLIIDKKKFIILLFLLRRHNHD